ncbi:MAG: isoleucine--tRNA ligase [Puniceicoccales bacterium]|jgi:isoleucyl-tRNA synthetase|nr:isoleucine--tRNA ligase [Puniceicoccales bacterium]
MSTELKDTLNLPVTKFPMKADLTKREPARIAHWENMDLYNKIQKKNAQGQRFILHDGPPFTNGDVHIGTALNKILKDIILRYKSMNGFSTPYIPGWDCHGLPIEHKVSKKLKDENRSLDIVHLRRECANFSKSFIEKQRRQFIRLGILADWENEYKTMDPDYESVVLNCFADFVENGLVYRKKKPVYWSIPCKTALAEAEIEYKDHKSPSIYVKFKVSDQCTQRLALPSNSYVVIWTTTPWTIPSNMAIAVHPDLNYLALTKDDETFIIAEKLVDQFASACDIKIKNFKKILTLPGRGLEGVVAKHPLIERDSKVILADYVKDDAGTGCVHTAPGHGLEDYVTGLKYGIDVYSPLDDDGCYVDDGQIPSDLVGLSVLDIDGKCQANDAVIEKLRAANALLGFHIVEHQYPFCWRSKTPVIFRAMDQWFIEVDGRVKEMALKAIKTVKWIPSYGENRIIGAVTSRPDWCISRQRTWGIPIPVFFDETGNSLLDAKLIRALAEKISKYGSNFWFESSTEEILSGIDLPPPWQGKQLIKSTDTLDVWIDSGVSHRAALHNRDVLSFPSDMYLEGSDQHRGWFQSSLLTSVVVNGGCAPYKEVLTHGFVVGEDKKKISKSDGKPQTADDYVNKFGTDILRLWIASEDFRNDVPLSDDIFTNVISSYRSLRNTIRFQIGNLYDFDAPKHAVDQKDMTSIDKWIMHKTRILIEQCTECYNDYNFHKVYQLINNFCSIELSAKYHDILKDRLYTHGPSWSTRRSSQTAIHYVLNSLLKLLAPILMFTTDEALSFMINSCEFSDISIHLADWPKCDDWLDFSDESAEVDSIMQIRDRVNEQLELLRKEKKIGQSLDAKVSIYCNGWNFELLQKHTDELEEYFIVSEVYLEESDVFSVKAEPSKLERCPRSWRRVAKFVYAGRFGRVSERCLKALKDKYMEEF